MSERETPCEALVHETGSLPRKCGQASVHRVGLPDSVGLIDYSHFCQEHGQVPSPR